MAEPIRVKVYIEVMYDLPGDPEERFEAYGTEDPEECVRIDWENDPVGVVLDGASDLTRVDEV